MSTEFENGDVNIIPPRKKIPHYHGDETRVLFMISALLIIFAQSTGANLPVSIFGAVVAAVFLVVAAGITSPTQTWIHWINGLFAMVGTLVFGPTAVAQYREGISVIDPSFIYVEALALLFLIALYFTTRTIRGILLRRTAP